MQGLFIRAEHLHCELKTEALSCKLATCGIFYVFYCGFYTIQVLVLVQFLVLLATHTQMACSAVAIAFIFQLSELDMHQTHLDIHFDFWYLPLNV